MMLSNVIVDVTIPRCSFVFGQSRAKVSASFTDVIQLTLTLKMTTAQVVETSVTVNNNSPIQDYVHPDDQTQPTFEMTPGFKPFTVLRTFYLNSIILSYITQLQIDNKNNTIIIIIIIFSKIITFFLLSYFLFLYHWE